MPNLSMGMDGEGDLYYYYVTPVLSVVLPDWHARSSTPLTPHSWGMGRRPGDTPDPGKGLRPSAHSIFLSFPRRRETRKGRGFWDDLGMGGDVLAPFLGAAGGARRWHPVSPKPEMDHAHALEPVKEVGDDGRGRFP
jgi:hypothetical protein